MANVHFIIFFFFSYSIRKQNSVRLLPPRVSEGLTPTTVDSGSRRGCKSRPAENGSGRESKAQLVPIHRPRATSVLVVPQRGMAWQTSTHSLPDLDGTNNDINGGGGDESNS